MISTHDIDPLLLDHVEPPVGEALDGHTRDVRTSIRDLLEGGLPTRVLRRMAFDRVWRLSWARRSGGWAHATEVP